MVTAFGYEARLGDGHGNVFGDKTKTVTVAETGFPAGVYP
jgi:hypothetical protein